MRRLQLLFAALLVGLAVPTAGTVAAQEQLENPPGPWTHPVEGTSFPRFLGPAERGSVTQFDEGGSDVGIGYAMTTADGTLILTLYLYPTIPQFDCDATYHDAKLAIEQRYEGARLIEEGRRGSPGGATSDAAHYGRYFLPAGAMGPDLPVLHSDLYLACAMERGWLMKYRATWNGSADTFPDIGALLRQIGWGEGFE